MLIFETLRSLFKVPLPQVSQDFQVPSLRASQQYVGAATSLLSTFQQDDSNLGQGVSFNEEMVDQRWAGSFGSTYNLDLNQGLLSHDQTADQQWSVVFGNGWHSRLNLPTSKRSALLLRDNRFQNCSNKVSPDIGRRNPWVETSAYSGNTKVLPTSDLESNRGLYILSSQADTYITTGLAREDNFNRLSVPLCQRPYGENIPGLQKRKSAVEASPRKRQRPETGLVQRPCLPTPRSRAGEEQAADSHSPARDTRLSSFQSDSFASTPSTTKSQQSLTLNPINYEVVEQPVASAQDLNQSYTKYFSISTRVTARWPITSAPSPQRSSELWSICLMRWAGLHLRGP